MTEPEIRPPGNPFYSQVSELELIYYEKNGKVVDAMEQKLFRDLIVTLYHGDNYQIVLTHNLGLLFWK